MLAYALFILLLKLYRVKLTYWMVFNMWQVAMVRQALAWLLRTLKTKNDTDNKRTIIFAKLVLGVPTYSSFIAVREVERYRDCLCG